MTAYRGFYLFFAPLVLALATPALAQESTRAIEQQVTSFLEARYREAAKKVTIQVGQLDPRLRLAACAEPLQMRLRDQDRNGGAVSVHVSCSAPRPWAIYASAQVDLYRDIVVATRAIARGERLHAGNIGLDLVNTSLQRQGYLLDPERAEGQVAKRNLRPGEALRQALLEAPIAINRGQTVSLAARSGGIAVVTQAEALANGRVGDQIRVRNISSERIISARVVGEGQVEASY